MRLSQDRTRYHTRCTSSFLFKIMKSVVSSGKLPLKWRMADGVLIPKVEQPIATEIDGQFRQITLMNVEAKLF